MKIIKLKFIYLISIYLYFSLFISHSYSKRITDDLVIIPDKDLEYERDSVHIIMWCGNGWSDLGREELKIPNYVGQNKVKPKCPVKCIVTEDKKDFATADGILFEAQPFGGWGYEYLAKTPVLPAKEPNQVFISYSFEHKVYFPIQSEKEYMKFIDLNVTLFEDSNVPITSTCSWGIFDNGTIDSFKEAKVNPWNKKHKKSVFFATNCVGGGAIYRTEYIKNLEEFFPVDAYGSCLHNKDLPKEDDVKVFDDLGRSMKIKERISGEYMFGLAFENNNLTNYVTEKVYTALLSGTLPIYMGAPNIDEYVPRNSIIRTDKFKSPQHLAEYLRYLSKNETAYNEYFQWKNEPYPEAMQKHYENCVFYTADCRMCKHVHSIRDKLKKELGPDFRVKHGEPDIVKYELKVLDLNEKSCVLIKPQDSSVAFKDIRNISFGMWFFLVKSLKGEIARFSQDLTLGVKEIWYKDFLEVCYGSECVIGSMPLTINLWRHIGFTISNDTLRIYVNGQIDIEAPFPKIQINDFFLKIGCKQTLNALIDDVIVWNKELSQEEMATTMFTKQRGNEANLLLYVTFNSGIAEDYSEHKSMIIAQECQIIKGDHQKINLNCCG